MSENIGYMYVNFSLVTDKDGDLIKIIADSYFDSMYVRQHIWVCY